MADDPIIRTGNVAVLLKLEAIEGTDAGPTGADAINVEADSVEYGSPWTTEESNEVTGGYVKGAALIVGQPVPISFRARIKGPGAGIALTSSLKPPLHQAFQACGKRGQFTPTIAAVAPIAGGVGVVTLPASFPAADHALVGMPLAFTGGVATNLRPIVTAYTAGRVATLSDPVTIDTAGTVALQPNWQYAGTSPADGTARAIDHPSGTIYIYEDGVLLKFVRCRGTVDLSGATAKAAFAAFSFTGIFAGKVDAPVPVTTVPGHAAPVLTMQAGRSLAVVANSKKLPIESWSLDKGTALEVPADPNTPFGFSGGLITERAEVLTIDPLATTVAARDTLTDIGASASYAIVLKHAGAGGNRFALTIPNGQPVGADPGRRGKLRSEQMKVQARSLGKDPQGRETDSIITIF